MVRIIVVLFLLAVNSHSVEKMNIRFRAVPGKASSIEYNANCDSTKYAFNRMVDTLPKFARWASFRDSTLRLPKIDTIKGRTVIDTATLRAPSIRYGVASYGFTVTGTNSTDSINSTNGVAAPRFWGDSINVGNGGRLYRLWNSLQRSDSTIVTGISANSAWITAFRNPNNYSNYYFYNPHSTDGYTSVQLMHGGGGAIGSITAYGSNYSIAAYRNDLLISTVSGSVLVGTDGGSTRLGIDIADPTHRLHVNGSFKATSANTTNDTVTTAVIDSTIGARGSYTRLYGTRARFTTFSSTTDSTTSLYANYSLVSDSMRSKALRLTSMLQIFPDGGAYNEGIRISSSPSTHCSMLMLGAAAGSNNGDTAGCVVFNRTSDSKLRIYNNQINAITVDADGRVAIGSTSSTNDFYVGGTGRINKFGSERISTDSISVDGYEISTNVGVFSCTLKTNDVTVQQVNNASYVRNGRIITLDLPILYGTSNSTTLRVYGIPAGLNFEDNNACVALTGSVMNNGSYVDALMWNYTYGVFTIELPSGLFTSSGTKGIHNALYVTYIAEN